MTKCYSTSNEYFYVRPLVNIISEIVFRDTGCYMVKTVWQHRSIRYSSLNYLLERNPDLKAGDVVSKLQIMPCDDTFKPAEVIGSVDYVLTDEDVLA